jgi:hypothetical protein
MTQKHKSMIAIAGVALLALLLTAVIVFVLIRQHFGAPAVNPNIPEIPDVVAEPKEIIPESYWVIGPFGPGLHNAFEPEKEPDPNKSCATPSGEELKWTVKSVIPGVKCLDFRKALQKPKTDDTACYALIYVHSAKNQLGEMLLGSDDTITVWLNGRQIHQSTKLRPGYPDQDQVYMTWQKDWNTVLIKVGNGTGDHLFFAKFRATADLRASTTME